MHAKRYCARRHPVDPNDVLCATCGSDVAKYGMTEAELGQEVEPQRVVLRLVAQLASGGSANVVHRWNGELMPTAGVLYLEESSGGSAMIYRFGPGGAFSGDTWHETRQAAEDSLSQEFAGVLQPWQSLPDEVEGMLFAQRMAEGIPTA